MNKHIVSLISIICLFGFNPSICKSQVIDDNFKVKNRNQKHVIYLKEDRKMEGTVLALGSETILFKNEQGKESRIKINEILKISVRKRYRYTGPNKDIGLSPTAFNLKKGERKYSNYLIFLNTFDVGINNNMSASAGIMIIPASGTNFSFYTIARIKITHSFTEKIHLGVAPSIGVLYFPNDSSRGSVQIFPSVVMSIGKPSKFINFSFTRFYNIHPLTGKPVTLDDTTDILTFGGSIALNSKWSLISDNIATIQNYKTEDNLIMPSVGAKLKIGGGSELQFLVYPILDVGLDYDDNYRVDLVGTLPLISYSYLF